MSSEKYATPLRLEIKSSRFLFVLLLVLHVAALSLLYPLSFEFLYLFPAGLLICLSAYIVIRKYALQQSSSSIVNLVWDANNEWILERLDGKKIIAELMSDSYVNPLISILMFKRKVEEVSSNARGFFGLYKLHPGNRQNVILLKDNINANDFRRLRVRLKVGKPVEQNTG